MFKLARTNGIWRSDQSGFAELPKNQENRLIREGTRRRVTRIISGTFIHHSQNRAKTHTKNVVREGTRDAVRFC